MTAKPARHNCRIWIALPFYSLFALLPMTSSYGADEVKAVPVGVVPYAMCASDVNDDGRLDLVVGGIDQDAICAVTSSGEQLWRYSTEGMPLAIEAADVDGDKSEEIVAIIGTSASKIIVLDRTGKPRREISPEVIVYLLELGDIDDDDRADIVVAGFMGKILAFNSQGDKILDKTVTPKNFVRRMGGLATGDIDGDGRTDIAYHSSLQLPGILDANDKPMRRFMLPSLGCGLIDCADINDDGKAELLYGSLERVRAESRTKKLWSIDLKQRGAELGAEAPGMRKFPWEYGGTRSLVAGNFTSDEGLEIASFASDGKFNLLSASGDSLLRTKTRHPCLSISAADVDNDGFDEALLSRLHYKNVYVANFDKGIEPADFGLRKAMSVDHVTDGLDKILKQIDAIKETRTRARSRDEKLHVLWGMEATIAPTLFGSTIKVIDKKMRDMRCDNVEYAFMFTLKESGVAKYKRDGICAVGPLAASQKKLLDMCRKWEEMGVRFYPVVSHMGVPTVMPETAKKIMDVAPNACQGYLTWETMCNYPSEVWYDFLRRTEKLARICVAKDKKLLFAEEAPFWVSLVSDPRARAILLKSEYKHVLVPVLKTLLPHSDNGDIAAYVGSMLAGEIDTWGITSEEDFWPIPLGHYRGCPDDVVMRQDVMAVALGARYIMVESGHLYFEPVDRKGRYNPVWATSARISHEARREHMAVELFRKGILGPVTSDDLLGVSSVGFGISRSPKVANAPMQWARYGTSLFDGAGLLNLGITFAMQNAGPHSLSRNLYGSKKLMNGVFPSTPWGIVPIVGHEAARSVNRIATTIRTDGDLVAKDGNKLPPKDAMPAIVSTVKAAASQLPFRADGVFISARRDGNGRYQVILMDTEMFAPADIETTLTTTIAGLACYDEITGERLSMHNNQVTLTVPAGAWRLLRFETSSTPRS